ncbi:MAG: hypothetical protein IJ011_03550 [Clostridia bacterium]|nr:hypothetical protein [Clostridia bacterium]
MKKTYSPAAAELLFTAAEDILTLSKDSDNLVGVSREFFTGWEDELA